MMLIESVTFVFFFLMIRRPPSSPLFPYTPLFRSGRRRGWRRLRRRARVRPRRRPHRPDPAAGDLLQRLLRRHEAQPPVHDREPVALRLLRRDPRRPHYLSSLPP